MPQDCPLKQNGVYSFAYLLRAAMCCLASSAQGCIAASRRAHITRVRCRARWKWALQLHWVDLPLYLHSSSCTQFGYEDLMAPLVAEACVSVLPKSATNFSVDNVRYVFAPGLPSACSIGLSRCEPGCCVLAPC